MLLFVCLLIEGSGGAAAHRRSSSAFWEHVFRKWAGLSSCSESGSENHRGELVLSGDAGGSAAGPPVQTKPYLFILVVVCCLLNILLFSCLRVTFSQLVVTFSCLCFVLILFTLCFFFMFNICCLLFILIVIYCLFTFCFLNIYFLLFLVYLFIT